MQDTRLSPEQLRDAALSRVPLRFQLREPGHPADGAVLLGLVLHEATVPARGDRPERRGWLILLHAPPPNGRGPTTLVALPGTLRPIEAEPAPRVLPVFGPEPLAALPQPGHPLRLAEAMLVYARLGKLVGIDYGEPRPVPRPAGRDALDIAKLGLFREATQDALQECRRLIRPLAVVDGLLHAMDYPGNDPAAEPRWRSFTLAKVAAPRWGATSGLPAWAEGEGYVDAEPPPAAPQDAQ